MQLTGTQEASFSNNNLPCIRYDIATNQAALLLQLSRLCGKKMMKRLIFLTIVLATLAPLFTQAVEYNCVVDKKMDYEHMYTTEKLANGQFSVLIEDQGEKSFLSRCSFVQSAGKVTCDRYEVDKVVIDKNAKIKKYYVFRSHFDVQLFTNLTFIENNGRGGIAYGKCAVSSP